MSTPVYSIIIPGFNRVEPLKFTLRSAAAALDHLPGDGEIILVDDGSTPPLESQLAGFAAGHALRHLRQPNQGSIVARLAGLRAAQGEFVLFLDSDDLIHPDKLARHAAAFAADTVDVVYDDMAVAALGVDHSASFSPGAILPKTSDSVALFLEVQPAPHNPTYRRTYLLTALGRPTVPAERAMDPSGDVWLYYNLVRHPARLGKINAALTAPGPHAEARYSQHWEKLGLAALLVAERFAAFCPATPDTLPARRAVGEAAFRSWRRLPRDYRADYADRLLALWRAAPRGAPAALGGTSFRLLGSVLGPETAGRWLRQRNHDYASCRTLSDDELARLFAAAGSPTPPPAASLARQLGLGRMALALWHQPVGRIRDSLRQGGPWQERRTARGRDEMERAAATLPVPAAGTGTPVELHLLTGRRFWYQTAFCLQTFARASGRPLAPVIYDDGTLSAEFREPLARLFPATRFVAQTETLARLDSHLPAAKFPVLRERWLNYPNIRKLTDPHVGRTGWKLILDSDLLFFRRPDFLLAWADRPDRPLHAVDCETSYGYSRPLMNELAGAPVADLVNVGLTGLPGGELDWEKLEHWCKVLIAREGASYYLEQALIAMLVAGRDCAIAPAADYLTLPRPPEALACTAVMHHYVAGSKRWYFQHNWRRSAAAA